MVIRDETPYAGSKLLGLTSNIGPGSYASKAMKNPAAPVRLVLSAVCVLRNAGARRRTRGVGEEIGARRFGGVLGFRVCVFSVSGFRASRASGLVLIGLVMPEVVLLQAACSCSSSHHRVLFEKAEDAIPNRIELR